MAAVCWPSKRAPRPWPPPGPRVTWGAGRARTGPPGVSASRHRSRAASCGWAANSAGVRIRALAMPAASSRASTSSAGRLTSTAVMIPVSLGLVHDPVRVGGEPLVVDQARAAQHLVAQERPLASVLYAKEYLAATCSGVRTVRFDDGVPGAGPPGGPVTIARCSSTAGSSTSPSASSMATRKLPPRPVRLPLVQRGQSRRCRRTCHSRYRPPRCPPCRLRPGSRVTRQPGFAPAPAGRRLFLAVRAVRGCSRSSRSAGVSAGPGRRR